MMKEPQKPTLAIDFDGTIVDHEFPEIGELKKDVKEALTSLSKEYKIIIYSCRNSKHFTEGMFKDTLQKMTTFLEENEIPFDLVDDGSMGKPFATYYIDDRAISFKDNWKDLAIGLLVKKNLKMV